MPRRLHVRMMRQAISPRLAISTRWNMSASFHLPLRPPLVEKRGQPFLPLGRYAQACDQRRQFSIRDQGVRVGGAAETQRQLFRFMLSDGPALGQPAQDVIGGIVELGLG